MVEWTVRDLARRAALGSQDEELLVPILDVAAAVGAVDELLQHARRFGPLGIVRLAGHLRERLGGSLDEHREGNPVAVR
jgi:hypothetical protein